MEVNVFGVLNTTNAFLPLLRKTLKFPNDPNYPQSIFYSILMFYSLFFYSPTDLATVIHIGSTMGTLSTPFYGAYLRKILKVILKNKSKSYIMTMRRYCMTKYALEAMTDAQRLELGESSGIRVCLARLGQIATPIFEKNNIRMKNSILRSLCFFFFKSTRYEEYEEFRNLSKLYGHSSSRS